jgi:hypothetical protein
VSVILISGGIWRSIRKNWIEQDPDRQSGLGLPISVIQEWQKMARLPGQAIDSEGKQLPLEGPCAMDMYNVPIVSMLGDGFNSTHLVRSVVHIGTWLASRETEFQTQPHG